MDVREIPLDDVLLDSNLNLRDRLDGEAVERYAEAWDRMPPLTVFEVDGDWLLADGFHRHAAAAKMGKKMVPAEVRQGTFADAMDFAAGANLSHGLPLTRAERRRAVEVKLRMHHGLSDRKLAEDLGVSRDLIARVRKQLVDGGQIPAGEGRVGADGKTYPASLPKDPNEHLPRSTAGGGQDDPRDRGAREADGAPWDDTTSPMPGAKGPSGGAMTAPWDHEPAKAAALADPVDVAAPTIEEMLDMMAKQVAEVLSWTEAEGFDEAYGTASGKVRNAFGGAVKRLAGRVEGLERGAA
ncbi:ParB N-terminal domain-containing protein [Isosphaeraceae bacterium EP7]